MSRQTVIRWLVPGLVVALPLLLPNDFWVNMLNLSIIYMILSLGLSVAAGSTGLFSLAQGAFFGIAAYSAALFNMRLGLPIAIGIALGVLFATLVGAMLAIPSVRLRGSYLCIATLGFSTIVFQLLLNLDSLTRGPMGLVGIPRLPAFTIAGMRISFIYKTPWYYILAVTLGLLIYLERRLSKSRFGLTLRMIREDELAATCCGVNTFRYKVLAFAFSAFYAGIAGSLYGFYLSFLTPELFEVPESIKVMTIVIVGGRGNIVGCMIAALLLTLIPESLRVVGGGSTVSLLVYGAVLVSVMLFAPEGLTGAWERIRDRRRAAHRPLDGAVDESLAEGVCEVGK
jgi:branched-chain amino acid transport system permease protein